MKLRSTFPDKWILPQDLRQCISCLFPIIWLFALFPFLFLCTSIKERNRPSGWTYPLIVESSLPASSIFLFNLDFTLSLSRSLFVPFWSLVLCKLCKLLVTVTALSRHPNDRTNEETVAMITCQCKCSCSCIMYSCMWSFCLLHHLSVSTSAACLASSHLFPLTHSYFSFLPFLLSVIP